MITEYESEVADARSTGQSLFFWGGGVGNLAITKQKLKKIRLHVAKVTPSKSGKTPVG